MRFRDVALLGPALLLALQTAKAQSQDPRGPQPDANSPSTITTLFTPEDDATGALAAAIARARKEVLVQAFLFTSRTLANALVKAHAAGAEVAVILDQAQFERGGAPVAAALQAAGVKVWIDGEHAAAHNKVVVIDAATRPVVATGSFNFTVAAQRHNAENLVIIRADPALAGRFRANWLEHRRHSRPLQ